MGKGKEAKKQNAFQIPEKHFELFKIKPSHHDTIEYSK